MRLLLVLVSLFLSACLPPVKAEGPPPPITAPLPETPDVLQYKGMSVLMYGNWGTTEEKIQLLDRLQSLGVNAVSLTFPFFQADYAATEFYTDDELTPTDEQLKTWFKLAHDRRMKILLRPLMDEANLVTTGHWRGSIVPGDINSWFENYMEFLLHYAKLAEANNVEILSIAAELNSLEVHTTQWNHVIDEVREVYSGKLTYSANWGVNRRVQFWGELDFIGLDAFFNLDVPSGASVEELVRAWKYWTPDLEARMAEIGVPILFTEIGCQSASGCYQAPWKWVATSPANQLDQAAYYAASCIIAREIPIAGIFWWGVGRELPNYDPSTDRDFNPLFKHAEESISTCYR